MFRTCRLSLTVSGRRRKIGLSTRLRGKVVRPITARACSIEEESGSSPRRLWGSVAILAVLIAVLAAASVAHAAGELDPTFDGDGKVLTAFGTNQVDSANAVAIQADGKIVAAGESNTGANPPNFALARYNPDGSLDPSFDGDGKVLTDFGADDRAAGVAIQADGRVVAAGAS